MTTIRHIFSVLTLTVFLFLFFASKTAKPLFHTDKTYADTRKQPENMAVSYMLPVITPTAKTVQTQTQGGVTITTEIVSFDVTRTEKQEKTVTYADPNKAEYDIYEVKNVPAYEVKCNGTDQVQFKIRIRNNEQVPLVLSQIFFSLGIDGQEFSFPSEYKEDWNKGQIGTGFEKEYIIKGPDLKGLNNAQIVRLFLNGVPTSYNEAGIVTKKSNFEWFFECKTQKIEKQEQINYSYETSLVEKRKCAKCNGTGKELQTCSNCSGKGTYVGTLDGKTSTFDCQYCKKTGKISVNCGNCYGRGENSYPKSQAAPVTSSISWKGAIIDIITTPSGANVSAVNKTTKNYENAGITPLKSANCWYSSSQKSYPIMIEYQGQKVSVLPTDKNGKLLTKIEIDFSTGSPIVKKGQKVN